MTQISRYIIDTKVTGTDKWIGSDSETQNTTKNFTPNKLSVYFNENQVIDIGTPIRYRYDILEPLDDRLPGTITFDPQVGTPYNFSSITSFILSKYTLKGNDVSNYLNFLVGKKVLISKADDVNIFGYYELTALVQNLLEPNFFDVTLSYITGNGSIVEDKDYLISLVDGSGGIVPTRTSDLINDGEDGINPFISALALTPYLLSTTAASTYFPIPTGTISEYIRGNGTLATLPTASIPNLQQVVNIGNGISNFGGTGNASIQSTNFTNNRTLYLNDNSYPTIRLVDNANASHNLTIDLDTLNLNGVSYNWSSIVSPSGFVPYTGATASVNLGIYSISGATSSFSTASGNTSRFTSYELNDNIDTQIGRIVLQGGEYFFYTSPTDVLITSTYGELNLRGVDPVTPDFRNAKITYQTLTADRTYVLPNASGTIALTSDISGYVPTSRNLTINGATYDLTADRSWTTGTVTSVGMTVPSAFSVAPSSITTSGTFAITGAGLTSQYVRGDGTLANFPTSTGGGSSFNYYLNGSISQGTFGGDTYYQMSRTPILGAGTNFTRTNGAGNGYIASFITDAGDPNQLNIPGGNWNVEFWFQASSGGGTPSFYAELYKVSATNVFTLIASDSLNPEGITNGTVVDQYFTSIPVPQTTLLTTDRLAVRIFVNTGGRTITLHTENGNLSEVLTTFSSGLTALNGLTQQVQYFAVGTTGSDFNISSATDTHTFNLPDASAINRGALSSTDWSTFNAKQNALVSGTNIKTINGNTVLGSGDLSVKGVHVLVKPSVGSSVTASVNSGSLSSQAQTANRLIVSPFIPAQTITCSSLFINVTTLLAGSNAQILIYSNLNGKPDTKIYQSANLDCSTTGLKTAATTQTFEAGTTYWIGVHTSGTQSLSVLSQPSLLTIFNSGITQITALFSLPTYGSAPTIFGVPSNTNGTMPLVGITI